MTNHRMFNQAAAFLAHPLSIAAMVLLFLNDQVFKPLTPSWLTGKLSDLAVLFLAPFFLGAVLGLFAGHHTGLEKPIRWAAFLLPGLFFAAIKTIPAVNSAVTENFPVHTLIDPTDLLALLALPFAWILWDQQKKPAVKRVQAAWVLLPLTALLLMADAAEPDRGITCVYTNDHLIIATGSYNLAYASSDGGLNWQPYNDEIAASRCDSNGGGEDQVAMVDPASPEQYRFTAGKSIERSQDGGKTWEEDYKLLLPGEAEQAYYQKMVTTNIILNPGPFSGVQDPKTGNIIFAMGHEGVLVHQSEGLWVWAQVGNYNYNRVEQIPPKGYFVLLSGEVILAFIAALLIFCTLSLRLHHSWWQIGKTILGWLAWVFCAVIIPPAITNGAYMDAIVGMSLAATGLWVLVSFFIDLIITVREKPDRIPPLVGPALLGGLLFLLPYVMWALSAISTYALASIFGVIILSGAMVFGYVRSRKPI